MSSSIVVQFKFEAVKLVGVFGRGKIDIFDSNLSFSLQMEALRCIVCHGGKRNYISDSNLSFPLKTTGLCVVLYGARV